MRIKSVSMVADSTGRRFSYPPVIFEMGLSVAVELLRAVGFSQVRRYGSRVILRKGREYRYSCAL